MLLTLASLKTWLEITTTTDDAVLVAMLTAADKAVKTWCKRDFESTSYTHYFSGSGRADLLLRQRPVVLTDLAVRVDPTGRWGQGPSAFASTTALTSGTDFALDIDGNDGVTSQSGILRRVGLDAGGYGGLTFPSGLRAGTLSGWDRGVVWPVGDGNIRVVYTAGYSASAIPADLQAAVKLLVSEFRAVKELGKGLASENYIDYSYSVLQGQAGTLPETASVRGLLASYRDIQI